MLRFSPRPDSTPLRFQHFNQIDRTEIFTSCLDCHCHSCRKHLLAALGTHRCGSEKQWPRSDVHGAQEPKREYSTTSDGRRNAHRKISTTPRPDLLLHHLGNRVSNTRSFCVRIHRQKVQVWTFRHAACFAPYLRGRFLPIGKSHCPCSSGTVPCKDKQGKGKNPERKARALDWCPLSCVSCGGSQPPGRREDEMSDVPPCTQHRARAQTSEPIRLARKRFSNTTSQEQKQPTQGFIPATGGTGTGWTKC